MRALLLVVAVLLPRAAASQTPKSVQQLNAETPDSQIVAESIRYTDACKARAGAGVTQSYPIPALVKKALRYRLVFYVIHDREAANRQLAWPVAVAEYDGDGKTITCAPDVRLPR